MIYGSTVHRVREIIERGKIISSRKGTLIEEKEGHLQAQSEFERSHACLLHFCRWRLLCCCTDSLFDEAALTHERPSRNKNLMKIITQFE